MYKRQEQPTDPGEKKEYVKVDFEGAEISAADETQKKTVTATNLIDAQKAVTVEGFGNYDSKTDSYKTNQSKLAEVEGNGTYFTTGRKQQNSFLITMPEAIGSTTGKTVLEIDIKLSLIHI